MGYTRGLDLHQFVAWAPDEPHTTLRAFSLPVISPDFILGTAGQAIAGGVAFWTPHGGSPLLNWVTSRIAT